MTNTNAVFARLLSALESKHVPALMASIIGERAFSAKALDELFERTAEAQYTKKLLFSATVAVMLPVVIGQFATVHQSFAAQKVVVSVRAVYDKLSRVEPVICEALVHHTAQRCGELIDAMPNAQFPSVFGDIPVIIIDGNHIASTEHRLKVLRGTTAGALPATTVVMLNPQQQLVLEIIADVDAYESEIVNPERLWNAVPAKHCVIADRLYCTRKLLCGWMNRDTYVLVRQGPHITFDGCGERVHVGTSPTGEVYEQSVWWHDGENKRVLRRVEVMLNKPTKDGDVSVSLITTLPAHVDAITVAVGYRTRWGIEKVFAQLEKCFQSEIATLAYPKAALFAFSVACAAWNILSTLKATLRATHPTVNIDENVSEYHTVCSIERDLSAVQTIAEALQLPTWNRAPPSDVVAELMRLARLFPFKQMQKAKRGPKKPAAPKTAYANQPHVSTQRLLMQQKAERARSGSRK